MPRRMKNIYKRKDGRWEARYIREYDANGKARYISVYARSYAEVRTKLLEAVAECNRKCVDDPEIIVSDPQVSCRKINGA